MLCSPSPLGADLGRTGGRVRNFKLPFVQGDPGDGNLIEEAAHALDGMTRTLANQRAA